MGFARAIHITPKFVMFSPGPDEVALGTLIAQEQATHRSKLRFRAEAD
jgi:hypothetical protein